MCFDFRYIYTWDQSQLVNGEKQIDIIVLKLRD